MNELALFAGGGGGILGGKLLGWRTVCSVEYEPHRISVLAQRQNDRILYPSFPQWDDIRTFDGKPWNGIVDVVSAGFPCQPFSVAGKGLAENDMRNGWPDTIRIIREVGPSFALLENVPGLLVHPYFGTILGDLAESGFDAEWDCFPASAIGAPHYRDRLWILAYTMQDKCFPRGLLDGHDGTKRTWGDKAKRCKNWNGFEMGPKNNPISLGQKIYPPNPDGMVDGLAAWLERVEATGNGQVPDVAVRAWETLSGRIISTPPPAGEKGE